MTIGRPSSFTQEIADIDIYGLCHPISHEVHYIGKANNAQKRLKTHLRDMKRRNTPLYQWIRTLKDDGLVPELIIIEKTRDWVSSEIRIIEEYKANGANLLNVARGGKEPYCPKEVCQANGRRNARFIHDDAKRKRFWSLKRSLGESLKLGYVNERTKEKMRSSAIKYPHLFGEWANI